MEETKALIKVFLEEQYSKTRWPFISRVMLAHRFGEHTNTALNALYSDGIITRKQGVNGLLVEYLPKDDKK